MMFIVKGSLGTVVPNVQSLKVTAFPIHSEMCIEKDDFQHHFNDLIPGVVVQQAS